MRPSPQRASSIMQVGTGSSVQIIAAFDSGGRSYGRCGSSPISVISPSYAGFAQSQRRASAGLAGADDDNAGRVKAHRRILRPG